MNISKWTSTHTRICTALDPMNLLRERQTETERDRERLFQCTKPFTNGPSADTRKMELEDSHF